VSKRLVVCCDGTWNVPDRIDRGRLSPSNVVHIALATAERDAESRQQLVFYDTGVGTHRFEHLIGGAFGFGLSRKVKDAYRFLIETYEPGDEIFLFGFSRGAYTARSTAGLIRNCGILRRDQAKRLDAGYELYRRRDNASLPSEFESQLFRRMYACEPETRIRFIGVWDTVGALGIPAGIPWLPVSWVQSFNKRWAFHDLRLSRYVDYAYQAGLVRRRPQQHRRRLPGHGPVGDHPAVDEGQGRALRADLQGRLLRNGAAPAESAGRAARLAGRLLPLVPGQVAADRRRARCQRAHQRHRPRPPGGRPELPSQEPPRGAPSPAEQLTAAQRRLRPSCGIRAAGSWSRKAT
jgi:hypothetical protein